HLAAAVSEHIFITHEQNRAYHQGYSDTAGQYAEFGGDASFLNIKKFPLRESRTVEVPRGVLQPLQSSQSCKPDQQLECCDSVRREHRSEYAASSFGPATSEGSFRPAPIPGSSSLR